MLDVLSVRPQKESSTTRRPKQDLAVRHESPRSLAKCNTSSLQSFQANQFGDEPPGSLCQQHGRSSSIQQNEIMPANARNKVAMPQALRKRSTMFQDEKAPPPSQQHRHDKFVKFPGYTSFTGPAAGQAHLMLRTPSPWSLSQRGCLPAVSWPRQ